MKEKPSPSSWRPSYPDPKDRQVGMVDCSVQTFISSHRPAISFSDRPLEDPACFWIDPDHIYARLNWGQWCVVEPSTPDFAAAICASHYCQMSQTLDNIIRDMSAPVYHIAELPRELFVRPSKGPPFEKPLSQKKTKAVDSLVEAIPPLVDAMPFKHVVLDGTQVDLVVSSDDLAVLFAVYPEDADYSASPLQAEFGARDPDDLEIPTTVLDDLVRHRASLARMDPHAELHLAIIAGPATLESMRNHWGDKLAEKDIELVEYPDFVEYLLERFSLFNDKEDGDKE